MRFRACSAVTSVWAKAEGPDTIKDMPTNNSTVLRFIFITVSPQEQFVIHKGIVRKICEFPAVVMFFNLLCPPFGPQYKALHFKFMTERTELNRQVGNFTDTNGYYSKWLVLVSTTKRRK
jgi:hypothetical protein